MSNSRRMRRGIQQHDPSFDNRLGAAAVANFDCPDRGAINGYRCDDCEVITLIIHRDKGVTPMFLGCRGTEGCMGRSTSLGYPQGTPPPLPIEWEWYRPSANDPELQHRGMYEHVRQGGLVLRKL